MLRVIPTQSAVQAKSYYTHSDYYTEDQELLGLWRGKGAERLGLAGLVEKEYFDALCDNRHPQSGERITQRNRSNRTVGYDFNFHAPKSLSLLNALMDNGEIMKAFQDSVDETMRLIEADAQARVRKDGVYQDRKTGELVWARFDHLTSRPVGGVPDPHLHSHCFVMNMTFDKEEAAWKAGQFRSLKQQAPFYQAVFHSKLAARIAEMGYPLEKTPDGWDVQGISRDTLEKFSRRTLQIEELAEAKGIESPEEKAALGATSRERKAKHLSMGELRRLWEDRLDGGERQTLAAVRSNPALEKTSGVEVRKALAFACQHLFERHSVVAERQLAAEMLSVGLGRFSLTEAFEAIADSDVIVQEVNGQRLATTRAVLAEEEQLIAFAREGRGRCAPLGPRDFTIERDWLNPGQRAAVQHVLTSPDRVMLIRGIAGSGKTSLMQEAVAAIEKEGKTVFTFAPSADASRGVLRKEGFHNAETVARLLVDEKLQEQTRGQVLWIDEAGLLGAKSMHQLFELAERNLCRVILSGDRKQHGSVERGAVLRILEQQAGVVAAEVKEIQRQRGIYKEAVALLSEGRTEEGFDRLDALGWVKEVAEVDRYRQLAADYLASVQAGQTALVVSPTHSEGDLVTKTIRQALKAEGKLDGAEHRVVSLTRVDLTEAQRAQSGSCRINDVLQFHQNAKGYRLGDRVVVREGESLPLDQAAQFQVFRPRELALAKGDRVRITKGGKTKDGHKLENGALFDVAGFTREGDIRLNNGWVVGKDHGHLTYGYVSTSHASQGKTVDRVFIGQSSQYLGATSREQFYVSASRGRQQVTVYTDDKEFLREAIGRSDERMAATELVGPETPATGACLRQRLNRAVTREQEPAVSRSERERTEVGRHG
jgi:conjugative relaxase-like TrwC/TraI family protein